MTTRKAMTTSLILAQVGTGGTQCSGCAWPFTWAADSLSCLFLQWRGAGRVGCLQWLQSPECADCGAGNWQLERAHGENGLQQTTTVAPQMPVGTVAVPADARSCAFAASR